MATMLIALVPDFLGPHLQTVFGILGVPIGMLLGTDSYFFGLVPLAISVGGKIRCKPSGHGYGYVDFRKTTAYW